MTKIIHVNRSLIAKNTKDGGNRPVYIVRENNNIKYGREIQIHGPSKMVYNGNKLKCGARAWIETDSPITIIDEMRFTEAKEFQ